MKISLISPRYNAPDVKGGIETYIYFFSKFLKSNNIDHEIISIYDGKEYEKSDNIKKLPIKRIPLLSTFLFQKALNRILKNNESINIHYPTIGALLNKNINFVLTVHTLSSDEGAYSKNKFKKFIKKIIYGFLEKGSLKKAGHIITLNEDLKNKIISYKIDAKKISVIPNGVDTNHFSFSEPRKIKQNEPIRLLYVGRIIPRKNLLLFLESIRNFNSNDFIFDIVGSGEIEKDINEFINKNLVDNFVFFHGYKTGEELIKFYQNSDVCVLPSFYEGMPFTILEAMSIGRACLIGNFSNSENLVTNDYNGFIIPANDKISFIESLRKLINKKDKIHEFGYNSRKTALEKFSATSSFSKALEILKKL